MAEGANRIATPLGSHEELALRKRRREQPSATRWSRGSARPPILPSVLTAAGLLLAACSSSPSSIATTTTGESHNRTTTTLGVVASSSTTTSTTTTTSVPPPPPTTTTTVPFIPITGSVGEFYSPSGNISCEIDYNFHSGNAASINSVLCLTVNPPKAVTLGLSGGLAICTGGGCLSNAGVTTPTLAYGTATGAGPFRCLSQQSGMTCTVNSAQGFTISSAGVTPIGGAKVIAQGTNGEMLQQSN